MSYHEDHTIEVEGRTFEVRLYDDYDCNFPPWENEDGHGPVRRSNSRHWSHGDKRPGEVPLNDPDRNEDQFYYDWQAAVKTARKEWGMSDEALLKAVARLGRPLTAGEAAVEAVKSDFKYLRGWVNDDWRYIGVGVRIIGPDGEPEGGEYDHALWGVESCGDYWKEVAVELAGDILDEKREAWRAALKEAREVRYFNQRDIVTV